MAFTTESAEMPEGTERGKEGLNRLSGQIIGAAIEVHRAMGPGLLESTYEACLDYELRARGLPIQAYLTFGKVAAVDFVKGEGLLMAPAYAVSRMLQDAGLALQDFDFYEIHEAFAAQVLCTLKAWESPEFCRERLGLDRPLGSIDRARLNVHGSSLAVGHPFAATGARILGTLAKLIDQRGGGRGLVSICTAGGMGVTAIVER